MNKDVRNITDFISQSEGLDFSIDNKDSTFKIHQKFDKKSIEFQLTDVEDILKRTDSQTGDFLQINFLNGKKILLTDKYIGFSPAPCGSLDASKLPKVVTTPDLLSVIEAIESFLYGGDQYEENFEDVKLFFESISCGAESIGFNVIGERLWVEKLLCSKLA